jgi:hypothetical protein
MTKYYVYHCSISEIDVENNEVNSILEAHSDDTKVHTNKQEAVSELRNILDKHCTQSLTKEIERLNRVVAVLDRKVGNASTVSL